MIFKSEDFQWKVLDPGDQVADKFLKILSSVLCSLQHLLVVCLLFAVIIHDHFVSDEGQTHNAQTAVTSNNHLGHCTHACVGGEVCFKHTNVIKSKKKEVSRIV